MDINILLYFLAGILQDFLITLNWRYIAKHKVVPSVILSFLVTIVTMLILANILSKLDSQEGVVAIITYSAGVAAGTFLAMKFKFGFND